MTRVILLSPEHVVFGAGKFDSDHRHLKENNAAPLTTLLNGPSLGLLVHSVGAYGNAVGWRFKVGSYNITGTSENYPNAWGPPSDVSNTPTGIGL